MKKGRVNLWLALVAALCDLSLWVGWHGVGDEGSAAGEPPRDVENATGGSIHLLVLNGTDVGGLARRFALLLAPAGCVTEAVANAPAGDWSESLLVNRRLPARRAAALAKRLGDVPVVREWDGRTNEDAVLVLGRDWERVQQALRGTAAVD